MGSEERRVSESTIGEHCHEAASDCYHSHYYGQRPIGHLLQAHSQRPPSHSQWATQTRVTMGFQYYLWALSVGLIKIFSQSDLRHLAVSVPVSCSKTKSKDG